MTVAMVSITESMVSMTVAVKLSMTVVAPPVRF